MAPHRLLVLAAACHAVASSSVRPHTASLLGIQKRDEALRGPMPGALLHTVIEEASEEEASEKAVDEPSAGEECGPSILRWGGGFFGCGFLSGVVVTVLCVGLLSDRNLICAKPSGLWAAAAGAKDGQPASRDSEPEPGAIEAASPSTPADGLLQKPAKQSHEEIFDNIQEFWPRCTCLAVLLFVQSGSSIILESFAQLVQEHTSLVYFLTMLVGLGGNAGVQSVVLAVRRFATNEEVSVSEQFFMGVKLAAVLAPLAFLRCRLQGTSLDVCMTVGLASVIITVLATTLGTSLALLLQRFRMDPAHASPTIQVIMDMTGLLIACSIGWVIMTYLAVESS